jgi:hypothetical protein
MVLQKEIEYGIYYNNTCVKYITINKIIFYVIRYYIIWIHYCIILCYILLLYYCYKLYVQIILYHYVSIECILYRWLLYFFDITLSVVCSGGWREKYSLLHCIYIVIYNIIVLAIFAYACIKCLQVCPIYYYKYHVIYLPFYICNHTCHIYK